MYASLTKHFANVNGKLADVIVRLYVLEETVAKLQRHLDSDEISTAGNQDTSQNEKENIKLPLATMEEFREFDGKLEDNAFRRKIVSTV